MPTLVDDSQITSKISKVFNRLDSSIEKTEKKISSFEENLSKKLEDAIDFTSSVSAADLCAIIANELDKKVIQVRKKCTTFTVQPLSHCLSENFIKVTKIKLKNSDEISSSRFKEEIQKISEKVNEAPIKATYW